MEIHYKKATCIVCIGSLKSIIIRMIILNIFIIIFILIGTSHGFPLVIANLNKTNQLKTYYDMNYNKSEICKSNSLKNSIHFNKFFHYIL